MDTFSYLGCWGIYRENGFFFVGEGEEGEYYLVFDLYSKFR